jgi:hypothetical protein
MPLGGLLFQIGLQLLFKISDIIILSSDDWMYLSLQTTDTEPRTNESALYPHLFDISCIQNNLDRLFFKPYFSGLPTI